MNTFLGIELGSTRIKAMTIDEAFQTVSAGSYTWAASYENGVWTYPLEEVWTGLKTALSNLNRRENIAAMGISAMMHGYLAFDRDWNLLVPFRTWQNTSTGPAATELTELFGFNIPQRWSVAHLYQAILNGEEHVSQIAHITTLAGYVHHMLTGVNAVGIGEASGMFPIDSSRLDYDTTMLKKLNALIAERELPWKLSDLFPRVLTAGQNAGCLTESGAALLDGLLPPGIPFAPAEGDAGTGMVATNAVAPRTGNVSAGTSIFSMVVLERPLRAVHQEIDLVATPTGKPAAMVHCNNCTSDLNAWVNLFKEFSEAMGMKADMNQLFGTLYSKALEGDSDCGGLLAYNYFSGEHITHFEEGRPLFVRTPDSRFNLANFMRVHLYTSLGALKTGMDILLKKEHVKVDSILGHGGLFKTKGVGQRILAGAMNAPVSVMETAGEGGAWGIALLASYMRCRGEGETLDAYLAHKVFAGDKGTRMEPVKEDVEGFEAFMKRYAEGLAIEKAAVEHMKD